MRVTSLLFAAIVLTLSACPTAEPTGGYAFDEEPGGPQGVVCSEPAEAPPGDALCSVEAGSDSTLLSGIVLADGQVLLGGEVLLDNSGAIACVGCDCSGSAGDATVVSCPYGVISPGLINAHDHISFTQNHPIGHGDERYDHRHQWRRGQDGHTELNASGGASDEQRAWGELRFVMGGATSINGSGNAPGLLRNLDADQEGLAEGQVLYQTFPLGDSSGVILESGCGYPDIDPPSVLNRDAYTPHIAEGITRGARNELLCLSSNADGGNDLTAPNTGIIHAIGITAVDAALIAEERAKVIWSPRSNVDLYGVTAPVTLLDSMGVDLALGTDWTPSGSMNVLRELACADYLNAEHYGGWFGDWQLWEMATRGAALAAEVHDATGILAEGLTGDIAVFDGRDHPTRPFRAILEADPGAVSLVLRGGEVLYGDSALVPALRGGADCEELPFEVCGQARRACLTREIGMAFSSLEAANGGSYDLFSCGVPDTEPSCVPFREGEFPGPASDTDGDGVPDSADLCPDVFDPIRPLDDGTQSDHDGDGQGDACDPCPVGEDGTGDCLGFDPDDPDGDGLVDDEDNCPTTSNVDQADSDGDDIGDACDACPEDFNEPGRGCPSTVYEVKLGGIEDGVEVALTDLLVTGVNEDGFFCQVSDDALDSELGRSWSGAWVYAPAEDGFDQPAVGDLVRFDATVTTWFGQLQLQGVEDLDVDDSGLPAPEPVAATPAEVTTGGPLAAELEGVVVTTQGEVTDHDPPAGGGDDDPTGEFVLDEALRINDYLFDVEPRPTIGDFVRATGVLRFANDDSKIEPRQADDVELLAAAPPALIGFGPEAVFVYEGAVAESSLPALTATLDRPAPEGGTTISLTGGDPAVLGMPETLVVPEGATQAEVPLTGLSIGGPVLVEATLDAATLDASVEVIDPLREPELATLTVPALVPLEGTASAWVALDIPALAGGATVTLVTDPAGVVSAPSEVVIAAGTLTAEIVLEGLALGTTSLQATLADVSLGDSLTVEEASLEDLVLSEVFYDADSSDDGLEWVEIFNGSGAAVDLSGFSLGAGGTDYTYSTMQLVGTIEAGGCFVVGGPTSSAGNGNPTYDQSEDFSPDLQNSGSSADGVALFAVPEADLEADTVPIDAVVYGSSNPSGLIDETGAAAAVDVDDASETNSVERVGDAWQVQSDPTPGTCEVSE